MITLLPFDFLSKPFFLSDETMVSDEKGEEEQRILCYMVWI